MSWNSLRQYMKEPVKFEHIGYFVEYMVGDKYIGSINLDEPDREEIGYYGRQDHVATEDIKLNHGRIIKKGTHYFTRLYPLCGRWTNKPDFFGNNE